MRELGLEHYASDSDMQPLHSCLSRAPRPSYTQYTDTHLITFQHNNDDERAYLTFTHSTRRLTNLPYTIYLAFLTSISRTGLEVFLRRCFTMIPLMYLLGISGFSFEQHFPAAWERGGLDRPYLCLCLWS